MKHYVYKNMATGEILFESDEKDSAKLTDVDVKFEKATGIDPVKANWIGAIIPPYKGKG